MILSTLIEKKNSNSSIHSQILHLYFFTHAFASDKMTNITQQIAKTEQQTPYLSTDSLIFPLITAPFRGILLCEQINPNKNKNK